MALVKNSIEYCAIYWAKAQLISINNPRLAPPLKAKAARGKSGVMESLLTKGFSPININANLNYSL